MSEQHYETRTEAVWPPPPTNMPVEEDMSGEQAILDFPRQSVLLLFVFIMVTLGIYQNVWMVRQAQRLNLRLPATRRAPIGFLVFALVLICLDVVLLFVTGMTASHSGTFVGNVLGDVAGICNLVGIFQIRNRLNILLNFRHGELRWFSTVWTFLFGPLYVQYKINRLRQEVMGRSQASPVMGVGPASDTGLRP